MFLAGVLMWVNSIARWDFRREGADGYLLTTVNAYGWPLDAITVTTRGAIVNPALFEYFSLWIDLSVSLVILFAAWFLCEWLIRRRRPSHEG